MKIADSRSFEVLSTMMQRCPHSKQYVVEWSTDGEGPMGIVEGALRYNSQAQTLEDRFNGTLTSVSRTDIQVIAQKSGDFSLLKERVKQRQKP